MLVKCYYESPSGLSICVYLLNLVLKHRNNHTQHVANNYEKLNNLEEKLLKIQDLYIDGDLSKEEYQKAKIRYQNLINELREKEKHLEKKEEFFQLYKNGLKGI